MGGHEPPPLATPPLLWGLLEASSVAQSRGRGQAGSGPWSAALAGWRSLAPGHTRCTCLPFDQ
eukprot:scaffold60658_cov35-Tisochrysis_lutea.AAC.1